MSEDSPVIAESGLVRAVGVRGLAANTVNNLVGSGIFVLPAAAAAILGASAIIAYVICAVAAALIALTFAELGSRVSESGGTYAYIETAFGPFVGFLAGVLFWCSQMAASAAIATVAIGSLAALSPSLGAPVPTAALIVLLYVLLAVLNIRGVQSGIRAVELLTAAKLVPLVVLVCVGAFFIHPAHLAWSATPTFSQIGSASLLLIFAFMGVEGALTSSGEFLDPARTVPRGILIALATVVVLYAGIQVVAQGVLGADLASNQTAPLIAVARRVMGPAGMTLLAAGAAISAFGYLCGDMLATPRILFAFGRDGFLPARIGAVSARYRTPAVAIVVHGVICCGFAISGQFRALIVLSTVSMLLLYFACALAAIQLRRRGVRTHGTPFVLPGGPAIPILACIVVAWMLTSASRREYISVGVVLVVATLLYVLRATTRSLLVPTATPER